MQYFPRLKILLQSKLFILISLIFIVLYIIIFTKVITYESIYDDISFIKGKLISYLIDGNKLKMTIKGEEKIEATYYIQNKSEKAYLEQNLIIGSTIMVKGTTNNPLHATIPNTFDYNKYLYQHHIYKTLEVDTLEITSDTSWLNLIKTKVNHKIAKIGNTSPYLYALILGETAYIDNDVYQDYQKNGTTHLFAVSGMHITAFALFIRKILDKLHFKKRLSNIFVVIFLIFYMFLIGFTPSVLRGGLFFIFLLINKECKIHLNNKIVLYLLFYSLVLINPFYVYDLGFVYSFLTSFGLLLFAPKITGNYFIKLIKVSTIAFLFSFPITIANFYEINLMTIINNVIIVPFVTVFLFPLTLLTFIFPFLSIILELGIIILENISAFLNIFEVSLVVPKIGFIFIFLYYFFIYLIYKIHFKYTLLIIMLVIGYKIKPYLDSNSYVYFLDVGQGDSSLLVGKNQSYVVLIDTGGKISYDTEDWKKQNKVYDAATNTITFLHSLGITKIDLLIGTHGDIDHLGYAPKIMEEIKVENVWLNNNSINELEKNILNKVSTNSFDKLHIFNLNHEIKEDENDSSLVLYFLIDKISFLIMGDAPKEIERKIISKYFLEADIIKIGHHGSKTSSDELFLTEINPSYAIISAGRNNRYSHPHKETLDTLNKLKITILNTQEKGSIVYTIKDTIKNIKFYPP